MGSGELFKNTIESLLEIASNGVSNECRIHALNILRNLYRESRLNQVIGPYVARGLILSVTGFEAPDWPVIINNFLCLQCKFNAFYKPRNEIRLRCCSVL